MTWVNRNTVTSLLTFCSHSFVTFVRSIPPSSMMASTVQKIQDKLFGRVSTSNLLEPFPTGSTERIDQPASLAISIPTDTNTPNTAPQRKNNDNSDSEHDIAQGAKSPTLEPYRERLAEKLRENYKGVEKYRLVQDNNRERHWKKWGPYLSDRQWVCIQYLLHVLFELIALDCRPLSERITHMMAMPGAIFLTPMPDLVHTAGAKMASPESVITTNASVLAFRSGTTRILSSRNAYLG